jgi:hypothetical protein
MSKDHDDKYQRRKRMRNVPRMQICYHIASVLGTRSAYNRPTVMTSSGVLHLPADSCKVAEEAG